MSIGAEMQAGKRRRMNTHNLVVSCLVAAAEFETKGANLGGYACMVVGAYSILVLRRAQDHDLWQSSDPTPIHLEGACRLRGIGIRPSECNLRRRGPDQSVGRPVTQPCRG